MEVSITAPDCVGDQDLATIKELVQRSGADFVHTPMGSVIGDACQIFLAFRFAERLERLPTELAGLLTRVVSQLESRKIRWFISVAVPKENTSFTIWEYEGLDVLAMSRQLVDTWRPGSTQTFGWTKTGWRQLDLGAQAVHATLHSDIVIEYAPGWLPYTGRAVGTGDLLSWFGSTSVVAGYSRDRPRKWSGMGGAGPGPMVVDPIVLNILFGIGATSVAFAAAKYFGSLLDAAAKDHWQAIKSGISRVRADSTREIKDAKISIAIKFESGWIILQGPLTPDALQTLEKLALPPGPGEPFEWTLRWDGLTWVLVLDIQASQRK